MWPKAIEERNGGVRQQGTKPGGMATQRPKSTARRGTGERDGERDPTKARGRGREEATEKRANDRIKHKENELGSGGSTKENRSKDSKADGSAFGPSSEARGANRGRGRREREQGGEIKARYGKGLASRRKQDAPDRARRQKDTRLEQTAPEGEKAARGRESRIGRESARKR